MINDSYGPLINSLPLSLADKTYSDRSGDESGQEAPRKGPGEAEEIEYGFAHPAVSRPQRIVWIPKDTAGLASAEEQACRTVGVVASSAGAVVDEKGNVDVQGPPPGEL